MALGAARGHGVSFTKRAGRRWDLILLDACGPDTIPEPLATNEFFADVACRLAPQGLVIANVADAESSQRERDIIRRMARHYPACVQQRTSKSDPTIVVLGATLPKDLTGRKFDLSWALGAARGQGVMPSRVSLYNSTHRTRRLIRNLSTAVPWLSGNALRR